DVVLVAEGRVVPDEAHPGVAGGRLGRVHLGDEGGVGGVDALLPCHHGQVAGDDVVHGRAHHLDVGVAPAGAAGDRVDPGGAAVEVLAGDVHAAHDGRQDETPLGVALAGDPV